MGGEMIKWTKLDRVGGGDECRVGRFKVKVHREYKTAEGPWLLTCPSLHLHLELKSPDLEEAKGQALAVVQSELLRAVKDITD